MINPFFKMFHNKFYDIIKQIFIDDVKYIMDQLSDILIKQNIKNDDDNLYVNNIIVKKMTHQKVLRAFHI